MGYGTSKIKRFEILTKDSIYKELIKYKPKTDNQYWFNTDYAGQCQRIKILEEIISKME